MRQHSCNMQIALMLLLSAIVIAIAFLGFFTSYISSQLEQLRSKFINITMISICLLFHSFLRLSIISFHIIILKEKANSLIYVQLITFEITFTTDDPRHEVVTRELEIIKCEMNRIKLDIDMLRLATSSPGTPSWNASSLLYTRLEHIESQISGIASKVQVGSSYLY